MAMKILIACTNLAGHLNPMLSIGQLLIEEGHEVVVQTASIVRDRVESIGATFRAFPAEFDYDMRDLDGRFPERKMLPPPERVTFDIKRIFTDPIPAMQRNAVTCTQAGVELIWASPRELLNVFQADAAGVHVITATNDILAKLDLVGKDLDAYSLETVAMFYRDAAAAGFTL